MRADAFRCADASEERDEPLYGTASVVRNWLLLEQPGAWGPDALRESRLPPAVAGELRARARAAGVRIVLIRKGARFHSERRHCYFARTTERDPYLARMMIDRVEELLDVDLDALRENREVAGAEPCESPVFLVCTHGRHDACCSIRGNQVSRIACARPDVEAWECSHIGGDRFAANLVAFPHGVYLGRVTPAGTSRLIDDLCAGRIALRHYRGRCCYGFAVQAAEYFVRREGDLLGVEELSVIEESHDEHRLRATFSLPGSRSARVEVAVSAAGAAYRLTCNADTNHAIPRYDLTSLEFDDQRSRRRPL